MGRAYTASNCPGYIVDGVGTEISIQIRRFLIIDLRKYPITFDSWYGSRNLVAALSELGFVSILIHGKNNYVMTIGDITAKLSAHKKRIHLREDQFQLTGERQTLIDFMTHFHEMNPKEP